MLDYLGIFKAFNEKDIKYIVVGGVAVNLHGIPRMTYDIDILIDMSDSNIEQFLNLMKEWGFKPRVPVPIDDFACENKRNDWVKNKNMKAFTFINYDWAISEIDVIMESPLDYSKAIINSIKLTVHDVIIPVVSINDLIKMKKGTGRIHDQIDIEYLEKIKDES